MMRLLAGVGAEEVAIHLVVDYNIIISRMAGRRVCPMCGTLYNAISNGPRKSKACAIWTAARLIVREDDREEVVRARLEEYEAPTQPLIDFFREIGRACLKWMRATEARERFSSRSEPAQDLRVSEELAISRK